MTKNGEQLMFSFNQFSTSVESQLLAVKGTKEKPPMDMLSLTPGKLPNLMELNLDKRVTINVGGVRFETYISTLRRHPNTRLATLAQLQEADESYDPMNGDYFFDRHSRAFEVVITYYRMLELHIDESMCGNVLKEEFRYWGLDQNDIEPCCWADYSKYTENKEALAELDDNFMSSIEDWGDKTKWQRFATMVWLFLEDPSSSILAKINAVVSMLFVGIAIVVFVLESHHLFQVDKATQIPMHILTPDGPPTVNGPGSSSCCCETASNSTAIYDPEPVITMRILDYSCLVFFTLEIVTRICFAPNKKKFFKGPLNIIDIICIIPHLLSFTLKMLNFNQAAGFLRVIMILRVVRVLRIFKLMKHYSAFKILMYTIKVSIKELLLMVVFLLSGVLMFASLIHYMEPENFPNIPIGIWWALVTMTTVGYGDKYPTNYMGYAVGSVCVIFGVLVIAFTVPVVVNNFSLYYAHAQTRKPPRKHKPECSTAAPSTRSNSSNSNPDPGKSFDAHPWKPEPKTLNINNLNSDLSKPEPKKYVADPKASKRKEQEKKSTLTPVETPSSNQLEEETQQVMNDLAQADTKMEEERARQKAQLLARRDQKLSKKKKETDSSRV